MISFVKNNIDIPPGQLFTAIIGVAPSKGARSPTLWNAVFKSKWPTVTMYPLDIDQCDLDIAMTSLNSNSYFLGGAVAMPYKELVAQWLGEARLTPAANRIGAVNCIYRNSNGELCGTNTDGEAALKCYESARGSVAGKSVMLLGCGGAGKAVATYLSEAGAKITIVVRNYDKVRDFINSISGVAVSWSEVDRIISTHEIIINTTDIGNVASGKENQMPLSIEQMIQINPAAVIYDIVYDPTPSLLLSSAYKLGLATIGGGCMNLEQAVLGFGYCLPNAVNNELVRKIMLEEKKSCGWS